MRAGIAIFAGLVSIGALVAAEPPKTIPGTLAPQPRLLPDAPPESALKLPSVPGTPLPVPPPAEPLKQMPTIVDGDWHTLPTTTIMDNWPNWQPGLAWGRAEYLFWYLSDTDTPPLVTSGANVLFGGQNLIDNPRSGARFTVGTWLDQARVLGVEAGGWFLCREDAGINAYSPNGALTVLSSPFFDPLTGTTNAILVSSPGLAAGSTSATYSSRTIWSAEAMVRALAGAGQGWRLDGLLGYRYLGYAEVLDINSAVAVAGTGTNVAIADRLRAESDFNAILLGVDYAHDWGDWLLTLRPTVGIGQMSTTISRAGFTTINSAAFPGGIYNLTTNSGDINSRDWTVVPQLDARLSKHVWANCRVTVGYTVMCIPDLARAGEQIDAVVNPSYLAPPTVPPVGPVRPAPIVDRGNAWLHGFTFGMEWRF